MGLKYLRDNRIFTICPHSNTALFPERLGLDYVKGDFEFLKRLIPGQDAILMLPGWESSEGAKAEKELAEFMGLKIYYWDQVKRNLDKFK